MEVLFLIGVYVIVALSYIFLPMVISTIYKNTLMKVIKVKSSIIISLLLIIQFGIVFFLYETPIITYENSISSDVIARNEEWVRETLEQPFAGVYSNHIPLLAYRFHIVRLSDSSVVAEIYYFPFGTAGVSWDGELYDKYKRVFDW